METVGDRLREERLRLKMNQPDFAARGGVKKLTQLRYESGEYSPDAKYLAGVAHVGADVLYIITGQRRMPNGALDPALVEKILDGVEEALRRRRQPLAPAKKAELVTLLYQHFGEAKNVERSTIERFLRLVA